MPLSEKSAKALMHLLLAIEGVSAQAAQAVGTQYNSLEQLLYAVRQSTQHARSTIADMELPGSTRLVGIATAQAIVDALA